jgi:succinyl-diaminopimelate desuccinylase
VQAKGVLMLRVTVPGVAAHGSTPWLGENAILAGVDLYRAIGELPFASESAPLFPRPSINLGCIAGGDAINKVPDECRLDVDIRYLPQQRPQEVLRQVLAAVAREEPGCASVGRDGASDACAFLEVGVPAVEFGPRGAGHHGPEEYVEIESLPRYRRALVEFARNPVPSTAEVTR